MQRGTIILNTFALSHYCEIPRWALDFKGLRYVERSWAPFLHVARTWRMQKRHTPVLRVNGIALQESVEICGYLETEFPGPPLLPTEHREAIDVATSQARAVGEHVRRLAYLAIGRDVRVLEKAWTLNVSPAEAWFHKLVFPVSRRLIFKAYQVDDHAGRESEAIVRRFLGEHDLLFGNGHRYWVGDRFTLADLTMSAMLSPLVRPPEHPFYRLLPAEGGMGELVESFRGSATLEWVRECYRRHRAPRVITA